MARQNLAQMTQAVERLEMHLKRYCKDLSEFENNFEASVTRLEKKGLPEEFVQKFRSEQLNEVRKQLQEIQGFISKRTVRYTVDVKEDLIRLQRTIGR